MASLPRRGVLIGAFALAACSRRDPMTVARTPKLHMKRLNQEVRAISERLAPAKLGVGLMNLDSEETFTLRGERPFPMQGLFKAPLATAVLAEADAGQLALDAPITIGEMDLSPWSPIAKAWPARCDYTARDLLTALVAQSDNTAADVLMFHIGGPGSVQAWLTEKTIEGLRIDRYARELEPEAIGLTPFRPAWRDDAVLAAAWRAVPIDQQRAALAAYLADPRDTSTPQGMLDFLNLLDGNALISRPSRRWLMRAMTAGNDSAQRLKAGLPHGSAFAHRTGTGPQIEGVLSAVNDAGVAVMPDGRRYAMAAFLSGSTLSEAAANAALAEVGRALARGVG